jgi:hypothetical protein
MKLLHTPIRFVLLIICMVLFSSVAWSQDADPTLPDDPDPVNAPIDGGVSLLVAAGIAYGAKKAHAARKKDKSQQDADRK